MPIGRPKHASHDQLYKFASLSSAQALVEVGVTPAGMSQQEAERRLKLYGHNVIAEKKRSPILQFLKRFTNPIILLLFIAVGVSLYVGEGTDALIISIMIILSVVLDFFQEYKADRAAQKLKERVVTTTTVLRNGEKHEIKLSNVCVGDLVTLAAGDLIPADCRVIEAKDCFVNQSALTGESMLCEKHSFTLNIKNSSLSDLTNMLFFGTSVVSGTATAVVVQTASSTEYGKIVKSLAQSPEDTEFDRGVRHFGYLIVRVIIVLVLFIFLINALFKHSVLESLLFALAIAVGLTPDLLPMILSVTMARGSANMAKHGVIVKKLNAIPNFGSMDVLCTDKTGTLTENRIRLVKYVDILGKNDTEVLRYTYLNSFYQTGIKNPMDRAVLDFKKIEVLMHALDYRKIDEIPFDFTRRRISIVLQKSGKRILVTKGAPEELFKLCTHYSSGSRTKKFDAAGLQRARALYEELSLEGYRVLGLATKDVPSSRQSVYTRSDEHGLTLIGFIAFLDPAKKDVKSVLAELNTMGIEVKVITGDNELVSKKICVDIGLHVKGVLLGSEMISLSDDALRARVERTTIFARLAPEQKDRVILALQKNNHVVGFLGDGINDAPSLHTADVGISVNTGVDVAKESADIILTHKSLHELKDGVLEGRRTFANTMKYIMMGTGSNFGNMFSMAGAVFLVPFLPMLPTQILLNNLLYDFSQITIPSDGVDEEFIEKPKRWNMKFIVAFMIVFGLLSSVFDFATFFVLYWAFGSPAAIFQTGWFIESLATQVLVIHFIRTKKTPFLQSTASWALILSTLGFVAVGWLIPYTPIGKYFGFSPIPGHIVLVIAGITVAYLLSVEVVKRLFYRKYNF